MRAVLQRVESATVKVDGQTVGTIGAGLLVLLGVAKGDTHAHADYLADKILNLRIFSDGAGKMNRSVVEVGGGILAVSQFTLCEHSRKSRRLNLDAAAPPES